jgi:integrase
VIPVHPANDASGETRICQSLKAHSWTHPRQLILRKFWTFAMLLGAAAISVEPAVAQPTILGIATSPSPAIQGQPFTLTINGSGIDPNTIQVLLNGPACSPCILGGANIISASATTLIGTTTLSENGAFAISLRNGGSGPQSNSLIVNELGCQRLEDLALVSLQKFLDQKAETGLSHSVVDHLRWDITSMLDMAVAERILRVNPATALYTPKSAKKGIGRVMSAKEVEQAIEGVAVREKVILQLAIFAGVRPGELLAIQRRQVINGASAIEIHRRVYRGKFADPKNGLIRTIAVPPQSAALLRDWMETAVEPDPEAFVFAGETGQPLWRSSLLDDHIKAKLEPIGLGWVDFQVMRRTHASLGHEAKVDPKVAADQRGHGIGVALDYTKSSIKDRATAAKRLERSVLKQKVVTKRKKSA